MEIKCLDDKLSMVITGESPELRSCARMMLDITNGGCTSVDSNKLRKVDSDNPVVFIMGYHKNERMEFFPGILTYTCLHTNLSEDAQAAAKNHYNVIKEYLTDLFKIDTKGI